MNADTKVFINVSVEDLDRSMEFFSKLGFTFNPQFTDKNAACLVVNDHIYAMLLVKKFFKSFTTKEVVDAAKAAEVMIALSVPDTREVDAIFETALAAGGKVGNKPENQGGMYSKSFQDLDGHIWEVFHMDIEASGKV